MALYSFVRPLAFALDAEKAHHATIAALKLLPTRRPPPFPPSLQSTVAGLTFPSPIGLAAGFDKDAEVPEEVLGLGFGFVEVGTVTPRAQPGNAKPRLFRLREDSAVINRLGFNNRGQVAAFARLQRCGRGVIGVNVGANKDSADMIADYVSGVRAMASVARYLAINISSPNTPGLRGLQEAGALDDLLAAVREARPESGPPVFLKVAPDLVDGDPDRIVRAAIDHGIDALIVANTTLSRPPLRSHHAQQAGGLSGQPLKALALETLRKFRKAGGGQIPLIGVGGIASADDAWARIRAGASLVQLYSAMVYQGPGIARRIALGLMQRLERAGFASIAEAVASE
ncbi:MAG: quinone-dependent dihydroorotate dehydrogenase [Sphingomicrobium sp.]